MGDLDPLILHTTAATMARYRAAVDALPPSDAYVASARDSAIGYLGTTEAGRVCTFRCMTCCDAAPLRGDHGRAAPDRHYGDDARDFAHVAAQQAARGGADWWLCEACDLCGASTLDLSMRCQAEHEAQQARWARHAIGYPTITEYGVTVNPRCRVY